MGMIVVGVGMGIAIGLIIKNDKDAKIEGNIPASYKIDQSSFMEAVRSHMFSYVT